MKSLGIIGSDNSHSFEIAKICNQANKVPLRVTHIAGESRASAEAAAEAGSIPQVVDDWRELAGKVDAIMIDHRHGDDHYEPARFFLEKRIPTFIDKPLTVDLGKARALLTLAARKRTPFCSFGLIPLQASFRKFLAAVEAAGPVRALNTTGPVDLDSPYGGIFFYGFHQVDAIVELMGEEVKSAFLQRNGANGVGVIRFSDDRVATLNCLSGATSFHWSASAGKTMISALHRHDKMVYLPSVRILHRLASGGVVPGDRSRLLAPLAILDALARSLRSGRFEKVASV